MWCGSYEPHLTRCLMALLRPGDTFLDVGAHIGYCSFHAAWAVGSKGMVYSFEPNPDLFPRLQKNLSCYAQGLAIRAAVWEAEAGMNYETSSVGSESGWGTLAAVRDLGKGRHISVQSISLDGFSRRNSLSSIRAIKIDAKARKPLFFEARKRFYEIFGPSYSSSLMTGSCNRHRPPRSSFAVHLSKGVTVCSSWRNYEWSLSNRSPMLSSQIVSAFRMNSQYQSCLN